MKYCFAFVASVAIGVILTLPKPGVEPIKVKAERRQVPREVRAEPREVRAEPPEVPRAIPPAVTPLRTLRTPRTPRTPRTLLHDPTHTRSLPLEGRLSAPEPVFQPHRAGLVIPDEAGSPRLAFPSIGTSAWDWPELIFPEEVPEVAPPFRHPKLPIQ